MRTGCTPGNTLNCLAHCMHVSALRSRRSLRSLARCARLVMLNVLNNLERILRRKLFWNIEKLRTCTALSWRHVQQFSTVSKRLRTILDYFNLVVENCVHLSHRPTTTSISGLSQNLQIQFCTKMYCVIFLSNSDEPWFSKVKRKTFTFLCSTYCCCRFHSSKCNWSREIETKYCPCCQ